MMKFWKWIIAIELVLSLQSMAAGLEIANLASTNITTTSAYFRAEIVGTNGTGTNPACTVFYGTIDYTTNATAWGFSNIYGQAGVGNISTNITELSPLHKYYYRWYAVEGTATAWAAATSNFWTKPTAPTSTATVVHHAVMVDTDGVLAAPTNFFDKAGIVDTNNPTYTTTVALAASAVQDNDTGLTLSGDGAGWTNLDAANITAGTLASAIDGNAVTNLDAANLVAATVASAIDINAATNFDMANLAAGTTAAAFDGSAITALDAANLTAGTVASAIDINAATNFDMANLAAGTTAAAFDGSAITALDASEVVGTVTNASHLETHPASYFLPTNDSTYTDTVQKASTALQDGDTNVTFTGFTGLGASEFTNGTVTVAVAIGGNSPVNLDQLLDTLAIFSEQSLYMETNAHPVWPTNGSLFEAVSGTLWTQTYALATGTTMVSEWYSTNPISFTPEALWGVHDYAGFSGAGNPDVSRYYDIVISDGTNTNVLATTSVRDLTTTVGPGEFSHGHSTNAAAYTNVWYPGIRLFATRVGGASANLILQGGTDDIDSHVEAPVLSASAATYTSLLGLPTDSAALVTELAKYLKHDGSVAHTGDQNGGGQASTNWISFETGNIRFLEPGADISNAVTVASNYDTIVVAPGFYTNTTAIEIDKPLRLMCLGRGGATILSTTDAMNVLHITSSGVTIENLTIDVNANTSTPIYVDGRAGNVLTDVMLQSMDITNAGSVGYPRCIEYVDAGGTINDCRLEATCSGNGSRTLYYKETATAEAAVTLYMFDTYIVATGLNNSVRGILVQQAAGAQNLNLHLYNCSINATESGASTANGLYTFGGNTRVYAENCIFGASDFDVINSDASLIQLRDCTLVNGTRSGPITYDGMTVVGSLFAGTDIETGNLTVNTNLAMTGGTITDAGAITSTNLTISGTAAIVNLTLDGSTFATNPVPGDTYVYNGTNFVLTNTLEITKGSLSVFTSTVGEVSVTGNTEYLIMGFTSAVPAGFDALYTYHAHGRQRHEGYALRETYLLLDGVVTNYSTNAVSIEKYDPFSETFTVYLSEGSHTGHYAGKCHAQSAGTNYYEGQMTLKRF